MNNPFEQLMGEKKENISGEIVSGAFACQTMACEQTVTEARYLDNEGLLTWECPEGHISKIENYYLD